MPLCRILGGVSAAFLLLAAWLFGETALTALCFKAIRISENGAVWELWPFLQNVYILSPALILAAGAVFAVLLAVTNKLRWWIGSASSLGMAAVVYILLPSQILAVSQYAQLRSFFGVNLIPLVSYIHLLPFQLAECLSGAALLGSGIGFLRRWIVSRKQSDTPLLSR